MQRGRREKTRNVLIDFHAHPGYAHGLKELRAEFEPALNQAPWRYNELLWEAGMIGHSLYLEAEAIGLRGTGIGCFFDDGVHELLGIRGEALQAVYHFTVGAPIDDPRLATLPPYPDRSEPAADSPTLDSR